MTGTGPCASGGPVEIEQQILAVAGRVSQRLHVDGDGLLQRRRAAAIHPPKEARANGCADGLHRKFSGRGFSVSARRSSGVISRLIGLPQMASRVRKQRRAFSDVVAGTALAFGPDRILRWKRQLGAVHVEGVAVGAAAAHRQLPEHVGAAGTADDRAPRPRPPQPRDPRRVRAAPRTRGVVRRTANAVLPVASAREEVLEDARRQERGEPVVGLRQLEAMQVPRRRLEVVAGLERHGFAIAPSPAFRRRAQRSSRNGAHGSARRRRPATALGDDEQELAGACWRCAPETCCRRNARRRRRAGRTGRVPERQHEIGDAHRRRQRATAGCNWKSPLKEATASLPGAIVALSRRRAAWVPRAPFPLRRTPLPTRSFIVNSASFDRSDRIVQPCGVPGGILAKSPRSMRQRWPSSSSSTSPLMTSSAAWLLRWTCRGIIVPVLPANVTNSWTPAVSAGRAIRVIT